MKPRALKIRMVTLSLVAYALASVASGYFPDDVMIFLWLIVLWLTATTLAISFGVLHQ